MLGYSLTLLFAAIIATAAYSWLWRGHQEFMQRWTHVLVQSIYFRIGLIGGVLLISQIPLLFVTNILNERQAYAETVTSEISRDSGGEQVFSGPYLIVPYSYDATETLATSLDGTITNSTRTVQKHAEAVFLPWELTVNGQIDPIEKQRSIYKTLTYQAMLSIEGQFAPLDFTSFEQPGFNADLGSAYLSFGTTNASTIQGSPTLKIANQDVNTLAPGGKVRSKGMHAATPLNSAAASTDLAFEIEIEFTGGAALGIAPLGMQNHIRLTSAWEHPTFQGLTPTTASLSNQGFDAAWNTTGFARSYPSTFKGDDPALEQSANSSVGVALFDRFGTYGQIDRAIKYALLIMGLTFLVIFALDYSGKRRLHGVQYLVVGAGLAMFYLLLLSLSEIVGFTISFATASAALTITIAAYIGFALRSWWRGGTTLVATAGLYGLMYTLLNLADYALLVGSGLLFTVLLAAMFASRNIGRTTTVTDESQPQGIIDDGNDNDNGAVDKK